MATGPTSLEIIRMSFAVIEELDSGHGHCHGEVDIVVDSDETAYVVACGRLGMTDEIVRMVADKLRPMGIKWMRGWGDGGRQGRVITANGPVNCEPWSEVYDADGV